MIKFRYFNFIRVIVWCYFGEHFLSDDELVSGWLENNRSLKDNHEHFRILYAIVYVRLMFDVSRRNKVHMLIVSYNGMKNNLLKVT